MQFELNADALYLRVENVASMIHDSTVSPEVWFVVMNDGTFTEMTKQQWNDLLALI